MTTTLPLPSLASDVRVEVQCTGSHAVLTVRGEVDVVSAVAFRSTLNTVIDAGYRAITLDFSELDFIDAAGLSVISEGARRLESSGGEIVIRSPSALASRLLDLSGLGALVRPALVDTIPA